MHNNIQYIYVVISRCGKNSLLTSVVCVLFTSYIHMHICIEKKPYSFFQ